MKFKMLLLLIGFSVMGINLNAQNCGLLDSVAYNIVGNGNGTSNYTFVGYFSTTSGGNKSVDMTIYCGSYYFVTNDCVTTTTSQTTKTYGPFNNVPNCTGSILIDWIGKTTSSCGGSTCGGEIGISPVVFTMPYLPVQLVTFTADRELGEFVQLNWKTASELNNDRFEIQRKLESETEFKTIAQVKGAGSSNELNEYEYLDNVRGISDMVCYRLKQVDFDNEFEYSDKQCVNYSPTESALVYPNPASDKIYVEFAKTAKDVIVEIRSIEGKLVKTKNATNDELCSFDAALLRNGVYFVRVTNGRHVTTSRIIVNH